MKTGVRTTMLGLLAASHGVNDFLAGWLLGGEGPVASGWERMPWLVIYAALAFAGQLPAAWLMDRAERQDRWLGGALALMIAAVALSRFSVGAAVVVSGVASALCHVAGGALALQLPRGERALGWFSAPGIVGLTLGGWLGWRTGPLALWAMLLPMGLLAGWAALNASWPRQSASRVAAPGVDAHDGLMLVILLALTLRSALWDIVQAAQLRDPQVLFALAASAAVGKVLGGWMTTRWPGMRPISLTLLAACLLLDFTRGYLPGLCVGVALLQSTIPSSIVLLHRAFGTSAARAAAYGLGLTVAVGGLVVPLRVNAQALIWAVALAALVLLWRAPRRERLSLSG
jgi:FSR family fosmidomycin resistance protein-like MFS transporter